MDTNTPSEADSPDTDARIDAKLPAGDRPNWTTRTVPPILADSTNGHLEQSQFFDIEYGDTSDLDGFVTDVTTIAQSRCEHATDYADIETLDAGDVIQIRHPEQPDGDINIVH
jgi:putative transposase